MTNKTTFKPGDSVVVSFFNGKHTATGTVVKLDDKNWLHVQTAAKTVKVRPGSVSHAN
jgi:urease accessory protein UreE